MSYLLGLGIYFLISPESKTSLLKCCQDIRWGFFHVEQQLCDISNIAAVSIKFSPSVRKKAPDRQVAGQGSFVTPSEISLNIDHPPPEGSGAANLAKLQDI